MKHMLFAASALVTLQLLAGCSRDPKNLWTAIVHPDRYDTASMPRRHIGKPYSINGRTYRPRHQPDYDETGLASWYGEEYRGLTTANGEIFDPGNIFAAHPTLPLPSYVDVENLENGRNLTVRVNDRGPFVEGRIISLTERAAEILGFKSNGLAPVRVRYIGPAPLEYVGRTGY